MNLDRTTKYEYLGYTITVVKTVKTFKDRWYWQVDGDPHYFANGNAFTKRWARLYAEAQVLDWEYEKVPRGRMK